MCFLQYIYFYIAVLHTFSQEVEYKENLKERSLSVNEMIIRVQWMPTRGSM